MKNIKSLVTIAALLTAASVGHASGNHAGHDMKQPAATTATATKTTEAAAALPMASAEVRKVDIENKKISLKHGEIKNLDMPSMTMVFQVKDVALLEKVKAGDKIMFTADKVDGAYTVMSIEKAK